MGSNAEQFGLGETDPVPLKERVKDDAQSILKYRLHWGRHFDIWLQA